MMTLFIFGVLFSVFCAFWRRWFGGGWRYCPRFVKYIVMVLACFGVYYVKGKFGWYSWRMYCAIALWLVFWALTHGAWFCVNDTGSGGEGRWKAIDRLLFAVFGVDESRTFAGNCCGMFFRYSIPALAVAAFTSGWFCCAGFVVAVCYGICGRRFPNKPYTERAEYLAGACAGALFFFCI